MPSSLKIWDYLNQFPAGFNKKGETIQSIYIKDEFFKTLIKNKIKKKSSFKLKRASEISVSWLEQQLCSNSFFEEKDSYIIDDASDLSESIIAFLKEVNTDLVKKYFIFIYSKKINSNVSFEIEEAKFWEGTKLLKLFANYFNLKFSFNAMEFILETVEFGSQSYFEVLSSLQGISFKNEQIEIDEIKLFLNKSKFDYFQLAHSFGNKKFSNFYTKLLKSEKKFDELRAFFFFMQRHILKMIDPSYIKKKKKLSQYDKEIFFYSKNWEKEDLLENLRTFAEYEILCKTKNSFLKNNLQQKSLKFSNLCC